MIDRSQITGVILCGGQGARLESHDKPLVQLGSKRIIDYIIERLSNQVREFVISCSRNVALYEALGHTVVVDKEPARGPLAGLYEAFQAVNTEWALTVPGDVPFIPKSLVTRLADDASTNGVAVPVTDGQRQNLCLLLNGTRRQELSDFYLRGGRAVKYWLDIINLTASDLSDVSSEFLNVNTSVDLESALRKAKDVAKA